MSDKQIIAKCRRKAKTAPELGVPIQKLRRLEQQGFLRRTGTKQTSSTGRPAVLFTA
jgi:hypothetical protein